MKHTLAPYVVGGSVLAVKYKDGVMMACDTLASYGNSQRFKDVRRMMKVGDKTIIGASGEMSDFQYLEKSLTDLMDDDWLADDGCQLGPKAIASYCSRMYYNRRTKVNPLWNQLCIGGIAKDGKPSLTFVDLYGTTFEEDYLATGFGSYLAIPLLRARWKPDLTEAEAATLLTDGLRILWARDCTALNRVQFSKVTKEGQTISEPTIIDTKWDFAMWNKSTLGNLATGGTW